MKSFLLLFGVVVGSVSEIVPETYEKWEKMVTPYKEECQKESNVNPEVARNFYKESLFPNDKNFQCYLKCIAEKLNIMDSSGKIHVDVMKAETDDDTGKIAEVCSKSITKTDPCEIAFEFGTCCMKKVAELHSKH